MLFIVATNNIASRLPQHQQTGMPTARSKKNKGKLRKQTTNNQFSIISPSIHQLQDLFQVLPCSNFEAFPLLACILHNVH